jgi:hypothetical protein
VRRSDLQAMGSQLRSVDQEMNRSLRRCGQPENRGGERHVLGGGGAAKIKLLKKILPIVFQPIQLLTGRCRRVCGAVSRSALPPAALFLFHFHRFYTSCIHLIQGLLKRQKAKADTLRVLIIFSRRPLLTLFSLYYVRGRHRCGRRRELHSFGSQGRYVQAGIMF